MTQQVTAVTWLAIPIQQQRQLIALLSQLVYRQLSATPVEERSDECSESFTPGREQQDSRSSPGALGGGLCQAIDGSTSRTASGVDPAAVRAGRAGAAPGVGAAAGPGNR